MILSHQHQFIFIKTEKTAGTSMEISLSGICGAQDVITSISPDDEAVRKGLNHRTAQHYLLPFSSYTRLDWAKFLLQQKRLKFYNHISAQEVQKYTPAAIWDGYFKFCFERNPWDKVISWYYWAGGESKYSTIKAFIESGRAGEVRGFELYTKGGIPIVDKVYQLEKKDEALADISQRLALKTPLQLPKHKAKSNSRKDKRHYRDILNAEEAEMIAKIFAREIRYLGYVF